MPPKRTIKTRQKLDDSTTIATSSKGSRVSFGSVKSSKTKRRKRIKTLLFGTDLATCKVPKEKLQVALKILVNPINPFVAQPWEESCHHYAGTANNRLFNAKRDSYRRLLAECRNCLLNRDWANMAAILAVAKPLAPYNYNYCMSSFYRYAAICLVYSGDEESLDKFLYGVIGCITKHDKDAFLQSLVSFCDDEMELDPADANMQHEILIDVSDSD